MVPVIPEIINDTPKPAPCTVAELPVGMAFLFNGSQFWIKNQDDNCWNPTTGENVVPSTFSGTLIDPLDVRSIHFGTPV